MPRPRAQGPKSIGIQAFVPGCRLNVMPSPSTSGHSCSLIFGWKRYGQAIYVERPLLLALICNMFLCNSLSKEAIIIHLARYALLGGKLAPAHGIASYVRSASLTRPSNRFTKTLLNCGSSRNISYIACASESAPRCDSCVCAAGAFPTTLPRNVYKSAACRYFAKAEVAG